MNHSPKVSNQEIIFDCVASGQLASEVEKRVSGLAAAESPLYLLWKGDK